MNPSQIKILDCTLRDGGYLIDSQFGSAAIRKVIADLSQAQIDIIECGFLRDQPHQQGSTFFKDVKDVGPYLPLQQTAGVSYVLFADVSRYDTTHLQVFDPQYRVSGIRACFFKHEIEQAIVFFNEVINKGYDIYVQPVDILSYRQHELIELIQMVNRIKPVSFAMVDTFGSMYPEDLKSCYQIIDSHLDPEISLAFHSHNNLQLSFALALQLIVLASTGQRQIILDSTLLGMGRGAGNTNTELLVQYLVKQGSHYHLELILALIESTIQSNYDQASWGYNLANMLAGMYNAHVNSVKYLTDHKKSMLEVKRILSIAKEVDIKRYQYQNLRAYLD